MEKHRNSNALASSECPATRSSDSTVTLRARTPRRDILVEEALAWLAYVRARALKSGPHALSDDAITRKAFEAMRYTLADEAQHLAVPSKLVGTKARQAEVRALTRENLAYGARLDVVVRGEALTVWHKRLCLGAVQAKHVRWLRPLLQRGATVRLTEITGQDDRRKTMGVNIAFAFVGVAALRADDAIERVSNEGTALGTSGDGVAPSETGDGQVAVPPVLAPTATPEASTGPLAKGAAPDALPLVLPLSHPATHRLDVVLYRDERGMAHATVPHACLHSPTGIEWGYRGAGPHDLALSVLCRFTDVAHAEALYRAFLGEVVARVPREGGRLAAAGIAAWITQQPR